MDSQYPSASFLTQQHAPPQQHQQHQPHNQPHNQQQAQHHHHQHPSQAQQQQQHQNFNTFASPAMASQQQQQQHPQHSPQNNHNNKSTLPPIQASVQSSNQQYSSLPPLLTGNHHYGQSPHPSQTPGANSAAMSHTPSNFSTLSTPATAGSMPPPSSTYVSQPNTYATSQSPSIPNGAAGNNSANRIQDIRPMPPVTNFNSPVQPFPAFNPGTAVPQAHAQQFAQNQEPEPTHVVGSQGRRGILPSVPGRPPAPTTLANGAAKSLIPQKDADGKFPCPHCNKTYLHAKHLKRHLLRHTGDRPYMCHLCKDTFSRSDILKRHFQKCSLRRGNPTGASHLAGQRRNTGSSAHRLSVGNDAQPGVSDIAGTPTAYSSINGSPNVGDQHPSYASSLASMSARSSRANSLIQPPSAFADPRHPIGLGLQPLPGNGQAGDHHQGSSSSYSSGMPAYTMRQHSASNPVPPSYAFGTSNPGLYAGVKAEDNNVPNYNSTPHGIQSAREGHMDWNVFGTNDQHSYIGHHPHDHSHVPKVEHGPGSQSFNPATGYNDSYMGGMHSSNQGYGEDTTHHQELSIGSR